MAHYTIYHNSTIIAKSVWASSGAEAIKIIKSEMPRLADALLDYSVKG